MLAASRRCVKRRHVRKVVLICACTTGKMSQIFVLFRIRPFLVSCPCLMNHRGTYTFPGVLVAMLGSNGERENFVSPVDASTCAPESSRGEAVIEWAKENGAQIHPHIAVASFESVMETRHGRQMIATQAIANATSLLIIPTALHMSIKKMRRHPQLGKSCAYLWLFEHEKCC